MEAARDPGQDPAVAAILRRLGSCQVTPCINCVLQIQYCQIAVGAWCSGRDEDFLLLIVTEVDLYCDCSSMQLQSQ